MLSWLCGIGMNFAYIVPKLVKQTILPISIHPDEYEWDETAFDAISVI